MLLLILLVLIFWVLVPALLTGWMLREHGRGFYWGLLVGALLGPAGTLGTLAFIFATERRPPRAFQPFYIVPYVGRLHVSTTWSLAGVVAFLCAWMVGGLGYELYAARGGGSSSGERMAASRADGGRRPSAAANLAPNQLQESPKPAPAAQGNTVPPAAGQMLSGLAAQAGRSRQASAPSAGPAAPPSHAGSGVTAADSAEGGPPPSFSAPAANAPPPSDAPPPPARPASQSREAAVSEVTRSLASGGHKVHVAISGDAQTSTLSISGPTLTRQAGNQLLGRARHALKSAGIRIVVMVNGQESWTYIL